MKRHKDREPLDLHGVLEAAVDEVGGVKEAADILGVKPRWLYDACDPDLVGTTKEAKVTFAHVRALTRAGARAPLNDLCRLAGGNVLHVETGTLPENIVSAMARHALESSQLLGALSAALEDGHIDEAEWRAIEREALEAQRAIQNLLAMRPRPPGRAPGSER